MKAIWNGKVIAESYILINNLFRPGSFIFYKIKTPSFQLSLLCLQRNRLMPSCANLCQFLQPSILLLKRKKR